MVYKKRIVMICGHEACIMCQGSLNRSGSTCPVKGCGKRVTILQSNNALVKAHGGDPTLSVMNLSRFGTAPGQVPLVQFPSPNPVQRQLLAMQGRDVVFYNTALSAAQIMYDHLTTPFSLFLVHPGDHPLLTPPRTFRPSYINTILIQSRGVVSPVQCTTSPLSPFPYTIHVCITPLICALLSFDCAIHHTNLYRSRVHSAGSVPTASGGTMLVSVFVQEFSVLIPNITCSVLLCTR